MDSIQQGLIGTVPLPLGSIGRANKAAGEGEGRDEDDTTDSRHLTPPSHRQEI